MLQRKSSRVQAIELKEREKLEEKRKISVKNIETFFQYIQLPNFSQEYISDTSTTSNGIEEFDIPEPWKLENFEQDQYPAEIQYKKLKQNLYKAPLCRPSFNIDDAPICVCTFESGCGENCENRLLYM
jgi:hypothetical protein